MEQINYLQCQIVNQRNVQYPHSKRNLVPWNNALKNYSGSRRIGKHPRFSCRENGFVWQFDNISWETNQILIQVGETIRELKSREVDDRYSIISSRSNRSAISRKSRRSRSSRDSLAGTSSSAGQRRLD